MVSGPPDGGPPGATGNSLNLRQPRDFTVVAELSSFRKVAERLHIAQPALTRQIQDSEE